MVASEEAVKEHNLTPLARIVGYGVAGCEPKLWGLDQCHLFRQCWKRLELAWGKLTRWRSMRHLQHRHSPARRPWTSPWRSSTPVEELSRWATPLQPPDHESLPTLFTS